MRERWFQTSIGRLRATGFAEGASFLVLLLIAMPLKYFLGHPEAVSVVGMAHGVLFLAYIAFAVHAALEHGWPMKTLALLVLAAFLPLGPFVADARILRRLKP